MFAEHQPIIGDWARKAPSHLAECIRFAVLSAQQPLYRVPDDMRAVHDSHPEAGDILFAWKGEAWRQAGANANANYWNAMALWDDYQCDMVSRDTFARELVQYLAGNVYGLGLAKAGFVAQLAFGVAGCLDTHNLRRFNLGARVFDNFCQRKTARNRRAMVQRYCDICDKLGGTEFLWDSWCRYVATESRNARQYESPNHVSLIHLTALGLSPFPPTPALP